MGQSQRASLNFKKRLKSPSFRAPADILPDQPLDDIHLLHEELNGILELGIAIDERGPELERKIICVYFFYYLSDIALRLPGRRLCPP